MSKAVSLRKFLDMIHNKGSIIFDTPVLLLVGRQYPLLFFSLLLQRLRKNSHNYVTVIDLKVVPKNEAQRLIQSSFLGLKTIFFLGSVAELSVNEQNSWLEYFRKYQGPHTIIAYAESNEQFQKNGTDYIDIPDVLSFDLINVIAELMYELTDRERVQYFFKKVLEVAGLISLEQLCLLLFYAQVSPKNHDQFCKEILPLIVQPQHSLFALSDAFFEKNIKKFLLLWQPLSAQFSIQFWISFWSEQVWRAYFYVSCMKAGRIADAKKIMYRLPYSFTQKSWKNYTLEPFIKGHDFLYKLDYDAKNGAIAQEAMLDLFCIKFISETL